MALEIVFWAAAGLIVYAHLGYPLLLWALAGLFGEDPPCSELDGELARRHAGHPGLRRGGGDRAEDRQRSRARLSGRPARDRGGLGRLFATGQPSWPGPREPTGCSSCPAAARSPPSIRPSRTRAAAILAFSDANSYWRPDALRRLVARFADERVGYACGQVRFSGGEGGNQEGIYWRYEMAVRSMETRLAGITAGNGAIYAVRREAYIELDPSRGQDIGFPFELTKRGWRAVYEPAAVAEEKMAPTVEGEFRRKRRMMWGLWDVMLRWGMLDPRGYGPGYALEIYSHRLLRYLTPWLHLIAFGANIALLGDGPLYVVTMALQVALLLGALLGRFIPALPFRIAYYYVTVTASIAVGLWDRLRAGSVPIGWEKVEGTR